MKGEVGDLVYIQDSFGDVKESIECKVSMTITAPRGRMMLFEPGNISSLYTLYTYEKQAEAIKAFMKEHAGEGY